MIVACKCGWRGEDADLSGIRMIGADLYCPKCAAAFASAFRDPDEVSYDEGMILLGLPISKQRLN